MYVCMYVCMFIYMYVCMYVCIYVYINVCIYVYILMYVCMHGCMYVCIYICICIYIYVHICIYIYKYLLSIFAMHRNYTHKDKLLHLNWWWINLLIVWLLTVTHMYPIHPYFSYVPIFHASSILETIGLRLRLGWFTGISHIIHNAAYHWVCFILHPTPPNKKKLIKSFL